MNKGVSKEDIIYLNFEKIEFDEIDNYLKLNDYVTQLITNNNKKYLFFDEIQHVELFEKAINSFRVSFDCSIFITGSNSKLLSSDISTLLTGRIIEFTIYPFSFLEANQFIASSNTNDKADFLEYLELGGFPMRFNLTNQDDSKRYLKELLNNICEKDVFYRDREIEKEKFNKVCKYVLSNAGREFNPKTIYNYLNANNEPERSVLSSIYKYFDKMEKAFLIIPIHRYNVSGKQVLKSNPKYYSIDNGFRTVSLNGDGIDKGYYLENLVCLELLNRGYEVYVGKTYKGEVDFIAINGNKKCYIQVAYIMETEETVNREFGAFSPIRDSAPKYVLSLDQINLSRDGIMHINIVDFLLNKEELFMS